MVTVEVYPRLAPITVENFEKLVAEGSRWPQVAQGRRLGCPDWRPPGTGEAGRPCHPLEINRALRTGEACSRDGTHQ